jgi:hypothetical protein
MIASLLVGLSLSIGQSDPAKLGLAPFPTAPTSGAQLGAPVPSQEKPKTDPPLAAPAAKGVPDAKSPNGDTNGNGNGNGKDNGTGLGFFRTFWKAQLDELCPRRKEAIEKAKGDEPEPEPERRAMPSPWSSPPFPGSEYQGYPLIGTPKNAALDNYALMKGLYATPWADTIRDSGVKVYGWVTAQGNFSTAQFSNSPTSYWLKPNTFQLDQAVLRFEREADTVQTDHMDWGFRSTHVYGEDYRYTTAGGWFSQQLLARNQLNGYDPIEQYMDLYIPWVAEGMVIRVGRYVACPDIETQLAPDNYLGSHSILFTYDTYTQTGVMVTLRPQQQWLLQIGINCGDDMAPWYQGAVACGFAGVRWVSKDNNDAIYACLNQADSAEFRHFEVNGQPAGHDNYNYFVATWEHRFSADIHTKTEAYFMWERDAELGGTPILGPPMSFSGGGTDNPTIPGWSHAWGVLNYTMFAFSKDDYLCVRNEFYRDETGFRTGFRGDYTSHTIGWSHNFNSVLQVRPELGYYRNWSEPAFDLGTKRGMLMGGFDVTYRF